MKAIADTGFLIAFGNKRDQHHSWAVEIAKQINEPLLTCEAVIAEACFQLENARLVLRFISEGMVKPAFSLSENMPRLMELAMRYADRKPDLADLCLIRLSELNPRYPVITTDVKNFRIYRRGQRERIPLIHPPEML